MLMCESGEKVTRHVTLVAVTRWSSVVVHFFVALKMSEPATKILPLEVNHLPKRRTLIKDRVGCVRGATHSTFPPEHVYGLKLPPDPENAGIVLRF